MSIKIEFNAETPAKAHEEMVEFARLFLNTTTAAPARQATPLEVVVPAVTVAAPATEPEEAAPQVEETPAKTVTKTTRSRTTKQKEEKPVEKEEPKEEKPVEKEEPKEEKPVEKEEPKEEKPADIEAPKEDPATKPSIDAGADFADCKDDTEIISKVRAYINTFNLGGKNHPAFAKKLFAAYGAPTILKMTVEQAVEFYGKLKSATAEEIDG